MEIIRSIKEMQQTAINYKMHGKTIGFVPTMGFLHEGHLSLIEHARDENDVVVTSIFVNPLQFGPNEDFERYPRDEKRDFQLAEESQVDILFLPEAVDMYPNEQGIQLNVVKRTDVLCGRSRPGHFQGVVTVLAKLFNIVVPDRAYFGMKDAQQVAVVDSLITDLNYPIELRPVSTVREHDGLAKSSRNVYLSKEERDHAVYIFKALKHGQKFIKEGETNPTKIVKAVKDFILKNTRGKIDYVEILNFPNLTPSNTIDQQVILAVAVHFKHARLIDNIVIEPNGELADL